MPNGNTLRYRVGELESDMREVRQDVRDIRSVVDQLRGARAVVVTALGSSILAGLAALASLYAVLR